MKCERFENFFLQLTDVEKGGSTVFPFLKVKLNVVKGAAAFWYNLLPSGEIGEHGRL